MAEQEDDKKHEEWERLQYPRLHVLLDPSNTWSTPRIIDNIVFPPLNHEGLHVSTASDHHNNNNNNNNNNNLPLSSSVYDLHPVPIPTSLPEPPVSDAERCFSRAFHLLRSKVTTIALSLRSFASGAGLLWNAQSSAPVAAAALMLVLMFFRSRWLRRLRTREESRDQLIRVIKEKDEKISQLLRQIAQMNEILLAFHGLPPLPRTG
ncbi:hypothetical protein LguiA_009618 [Lonicera macranthoides]